MRDNGKLMSEMHAQTKYLPEWFYYYGGLADKIQGAVVPSDRPDHFTYILKEPVGVCAFITPWNSPLMLVGWKLAPALAAGCTVVIKPSEFTTASLLEFMKLVIEPAELPPGVINVVTGYGAVVGEPLVTHPKVAKVAFTGGTRDGRARQRAGRQDLQEGVAGARRQVAQHRVRRLHPRRCRQRRHLRHLRRHRARPASPARGCCCRRRSTTSSSRSWWPWPRPARLGDPSKLETQVGPVTTPPQYQKILSYIDIAKGEGAKCVLGGGPATKEEGGGKYFVKPTIFTGVNNKMRIAQEEVFGPVLSVIKFKDEEEAVAIANDIAYGLGAGIWTQSVRRATTVSKRIRAGTVWVNTYRAVSFLMPFGGYKASGLGRENGAEAIEGYLQSKSVWINNGPGGGNPFIMKTS